MRTRVPFAGAVLALLVTSFGLMCPAQDDKPKFTIKEVMDKAHKSKLCGKVADGKASKEEKEMLVEYYVALTKNKPPKGDAKSWEEKTKALVDAAKECLADDKKGGPKLKIAVNCAACHKEHKG